jgi:hypothetical protein
VGVAVVAQEAAPSVLEGGAQSVVGQPHLGPEDGDRTARDEQPCGVGQREVGVVQCMAEAA